MKILVRCQFRLLTIFILQLLFISLLISDPWTAILVPNNMKTICFATHIGCVYCSSIRFWPSSLFLFCLLKWRQTNHRTIMRVRGPTVATTGTMTFFELAASKQRKYLNGHEILL